MKRSWLPAALLAVVLLPAAAMALPPKPDAEALLEKGIAQFEAGELKAADKTLQGAIAASSGQAAARAHLYRGMVLLTLGRQADGERALTESLRADPLVAPDESRIKTALIERFRAIRSRLSGVLEVRSDRSDALVSLDGEQAGGPDVTRPLPIGRHRIEAATSDGTWRAAAREIVIPVDGKVLVELELAPIEGTLRITSIPEGAAVTIDEKPAGNAPLVLVIGVGTHEVAVRHEAQEWRETVEIREGKETVRHAELGGTEAAAAPSAATAEARTAAVSSSHWSRPAGISLLAVGGVGAAGSAAFAFLGAGVDQEIRDGGMTTPQEILDAESRGQTFNRAALGCAVVAGLGLGAGALLLLLGPDDAAPVAVTGSFDGAGASLVVTGRLP